MCGIVGYHSFVETDSYKNDLEKAVLKLNLRGPDNQNTKIMGNTGLAHARLSIIDTSPLANQPMSDSSGRYTLIFNGEIYNYKELQKQAAEVSYKTSSDTEVLLHLLIKKGKECLNSLNGFFALAFHDKETNELLIARDAYGIKPLHYRLDEKGILFASEMKALMEFPFERKINHQSLYWYLKLNYLPMHLSMLEGVQKLLPGYFISIKNKQVNIEKYHKEENFTHNKTSLSYEKAQKQLIDVLDESVNKRLVADVPLGSFLSGGTDSSVIATLAARHKPDLQTFSIGYRDHEFFDETHFAELVAKKIGTNHTTFSLTNDDLLDDLSNIVNYIDEPFADSSAIPTYILAKKVKQKVTVALSGDGADELFGGYYKHLALAKCLQSNITNITLKNLNFIFSNLPQSRSGKWSNLFRRLDKFGKMLKMSGSERYWHAASLTQDPSFLLKNTVKLSEIEEVKTMILGENPTFEDYLQADLKMLLPGDMLTKVDLMSMANSLEVRVPFLDKSVVNFAHSLPQSFKIQGQYRKRILQDAFKELLPQELHHRPKKGFEVPLLDWMRKELLAELDDTVFNQAFLEEQNLFNCHSVMNLRVQLLSNNPKDVHGTIWALYVFQKWYQRTINF